MKVDGFTGKDSLGKAGKFSDLQGACAVPKHTVLGTGLVIQCMFHFNVKSPPLHDFQYADEEKYIKRWLWKGFQEPSRVFPAQTGFSGGWFLAFFM